MVQYLEHEVEGLKEAARDHRHESAFRSHGTRSSASAPLHLKKPSSRMALVMLTMSAVFGFSPSPSIR